jgi:hypothetical protein
VHVAAVPQVCLPVLHGSGLVEHAAPAVQVMQPPSPSQTLPVPQDVPAFSGGPLLQTAAPVEHFVRPCVQAPPGFVVHAAPAVQAMHVPVGVHTSFVPHDAPASRLPVVSLHATAGAHVRLPLRQAVGFVSQAEPLTQVMQVPPLQTLEVPHVVPSPAGSPSMHVGAPSAHDVVPSWQTGSGLPEHVLPASQVTSSWQLLPTQCSPAGHAGLQPIAVPPPLLLPPTPVVPPPLLPEPPPVPPPPKPPSSPVSHALRQKPSSQQASPSLQVPSASHLKPGGFVEITWQALERQTKVSRALRMGPLNPSRKECP